MDISNPQMGELILEKVKLCPFYTKGRCCICEPFGKLKLKDKWFKCRSNFEGCFHYRTI